ncbi:hypothetical protein D3C76_1505860 [compost metagenome]
MLGTENRPDHIGLHDLEQTKLGHFLHPGFLPHGACVVDQRCDPAQLGVHAVEQVDHFILDADVGAHGDGFCAQCTHQLKYKVRRLFVGLVVDADAIPLTRSEQRSGGAYAAAGTGDDDDFFHGQYLASVR